MTAKHLVVLLAAALLLAASAAAKDRLAPFQIDPPEGFVPDAETAAKISEVVLIRLFGEANTDMERPLVASPCEK